MEQETGNSYRFIPPSGEPEGREKKHPHRLASAHLIYKETDKEGILPIGL